MSSGRGNLVRAREVEGGSEPEVGAHSIVLDGAGRPVAVIRTTSVRRTRKGEVDDDHAFWEGEDDRTLASFRREHVKHYNRVAERLGFEFSEDMDVILERFDRVYPVDDLF